MQNCCCYYWLANLLLCCGNIIAANHLAEDILNINLMWHGLKTENCPIQFSVIVVIGHCVVVIPVCVAKVRIFSQYIIGRHYNIRIRNGCYWFVLLCSNRTVVQIVYCLRLCQWLPQKDLNPGPFCQCSILYGLHVSRCLTVG